MAELEDYFRGKFEELEAADHLPTIASKLPELLEELRDVDRCAAMAAVAALATDPAFHANTPRLETLAHLVCTCAEGSARPTLAHLDKWLNTYLGESIVCQAEDPVEDVFVSNVITGRGNCRLFLGNWDNSDYWTQEVVDILETTPDTAAFRQLRNQIQALLSLSDLLAKRCGLKRYTISTSAPSQPIAIPEEVKLSEATGRVIFTPHDLQEAGIEGKWLDPFVLSEESRSKLSQGRIGNSSLERAPLIRSGTDLLFALPSAVGASIRRHVIESINALGQLRTFNQVLRKKQRRDLSQEALRPSRFLSDEAKTLPSSHIDSRWLSEGAFTFDAGKFAHVVLLHDDVGEIAKDGLNSVHRTPKASQEKLMGHLSRCAEGFAARSDYVGGLSIVVIGGLGRGYALMTPVLPRGWEIVVWTLPDLIQLSWLEEEWLLKLWKLHIQVARLRGTGVRFDLGVEHVNLFAFWRENRRRLVPLDFEFGKENTDIMLSPGFVSSFRQAGRKSFDEHAVFKPIDRQWIPVRKKIAQGYFKEVEAQPVYVSPSYAIRGILCGVVESPVRAWWVESTTAPDAPPIREFAYQIWDCVLSWMEKLAPQLDDRLQSLPAGNIQFDLDLTCMSKFTETSDMLKAEANGAAPVTFAKASVSSATLKIAPSFFRLLARPENDGERELIKAIVQASYDLAGGYDLSEIDTITQTVLPDTGARFLHLIPAQNIRDEVAYFDRPDGRLVQEEDFRFAALGAAWLTRSPGKTQDIEGRDSCLRFLNGVVERVWFGIREKLLTLDRTAVIYKCLRNIEGVALDEAQWRRTARAMLAVARDRDDVVRAAGNREKERARASIASRVLIEMAVCECPLKGGKLPGDAELDGLIADVIMLISTAYDSDAVHSSLTEAKVRIWPNGEFEISEAFVEEVAEPYQAAFHSERFLAHSAEYDRLFESKETGRKIDELFTAPFVRAFAGEYSIPLQKLVKVDEALQDYALGLKKMVTSISLQDLSRLLKEQAGLKQEEIDGLMESFGLHPRGRWDVPPRGFRNKDLQPWRFRRPLSLLARPIVLLGSESEHNVLYSAGLVHKGFAYTVESAHLGRFEPEYFRTPAMRSWIGAVNNQKGHEFNDQVAEEFRKNGFHARSSVNMAEFNPPVEAGDLGDLDALAWTDEGLVYVAECKNLRFAMTIGEIAEQLKRFKGEATDELGRHLKRYDWLREHQERLRSVLGLQKILSLRSLLVTNTIVPMQFKRDLAIPAEEVVPFAQLASATRRLSKH